MTLPVRPPVSPMLAKLTRELPDGDYLYEPKWDGFRAIVFRDGDDVEIGSRNERPLTRYFPELVDALRDAPPGALRRRRRDRDRDRARARLRPAVAADPPGGVTRREAGRGDARRRSSPSTCSRKATTTCATFRSPKRRARLETRVQEGRSRRCSSRRRPPIASTRPSGSSGSRARVSTASSPSRSTARTGRASARCRR